MSFLVNLWRQLPLRAKIGAVLLGIFILAGIIGPLVAPYEPSYQNPSPNLSLTPPSAQYLLGTTQSGQDVLSQLLSGIRLTLELAFEVGVIATALSVIVGVTSAFLGGFWDELLSLITNVFPPEERGRAISYWAAIAGIGVALGPVSGGLLLERFYWGSIFLVNLPIVAVALVAGGFLLPKSSDPSHPRLDLVGATLSITGLLALVYGIIDGPLDGWGSARIIGAFAAAVVLLAGFAWWESHSDHPMLNISFFRNPRFSAASSGLMLIFFAMFGATFLLTQYLQFVMGYSALRAGTALLPWAAIMLVRDPIPRRRSRSTGRTKLRKFSKSTKPRSASPWFLST